MTHCDISGRTRLLKWNSFQGAFSIYLCTFVHIILLCIMNGTRPRLHLIFASTASGLRMP